MKKSCHDQHSTQDLAGHNEDSWEIICPSLGEVNNGGMPIESQMASDADETFPLYIILVKFWVRSLPEGASWSL